MKRSVLSVFAVVGLSASAFAAPFNAVSFEAGGGLSGIAGDGFTSSGSGFYNPTGAGTNGSVQPVFASNPWTETQAYDSFFTLSSSAARILEADGGTDTLSPQIASYYGYSTSADASSVILGPGSHIGGTGDNDGQSPFSAGPANRARAGVATDPSGSGSAVTPSGIGFGGVDGVFIGQFTVNRGATLTGGIFFTVLTAQGDGDGQTLVLNGPAVNFETAPGVFQPLVLKSHLVGQATNLVHSRAGGNLGTGSGNAQRFGNADVLHVWVEVVPAPTAVAAFGLAGLAGLRRRRA